MQSIKRRISGSFINGLWIQFTNKVVKESLLRIGDALRIRLEIYYGKSTSIWGVLMRKPVYRRQSENEVFTQDKLRTTAAIDVGVG